MMRKTNSAVLSCTGAVIGAGFASGREVVVFFTRYGLHAWWLIGLAALGMTALCALCMHEAVEKNACENWCALADNRKLPQRCFILLMVITAGAMISAAGHLAELVWTHRAAYAAGVLGTLLAAWRIGLGRMKMLSVVSGVLSFALLCALLALLQERSPETIALQRTYTAAELAAAAFAAIGYAAMNMMLAMGIVCRNAQCTGHLAQTAVLFGCMVGVLLLISNCVYVRYPENLNAAFPVVPLLARAGRKGYLFSILLLYLAILTTLTSIIYSLRAASEGVTKRRELRMVLYLVLPLAASGIGFAEMVERFYAPAGWLCMLALFCPLAGKVLRRKLKQVSLDNLN